MTFDPAQRRPGGPPRRSGPRGKVAESSARCGWCQRIDTRPLERRDLRRWRWSPELGAVHGWCLKHARRLGAVGSSSRPLQEELEDQEAPRGRPGPGARPAWWYRELEGRPVPVWLLRPHERLPLVEIVGRRVQEGPGRPYDPRVSPRWVQGRAVSVRTSPQRELRGFGAQSLGGLLSRLTSSTD